MTDSGSGHDRDSEGTESFFENIHGKPFVWFRLGGVAVGELSAYDSGGVVEAARFDELSEHPVDFVRGFADVFDKDDFSGALELMGGAAHGAEEGEVSAGELTGCSALSDRLEGVLVAFIGGVFEFEGGWGLEDD